MLIFQIWQRARDLFLLSLSLFLIRLSAVASQCSQQILTNLGTAANANVTAERHMPVSPSNRRSRRSGAEEKALSSPTPSSSSSLLSPPGSSSKSSQRRNRSRNRRRQNQNNKTHCSYVPIASQRSSQKGNSTPSTFSPSTCTLSGPFVQNPLLSLISGVFRSSTAFQENIASFVKMVADSLVYHPTVAHYLRFVATTVGRDKVLRTIQYFARFLTFYLHRKGHPAARIAMWAAIKNQLGLTRKLMRVGKNVEHFKTAGEIADRKGMDPILRYCAVGRQLGYGTYLTFDAMHYLDQSGIWRFEGAKRVQRYAQKAWLVGIVFSVLSGLYALSRIREREHKLAGAKEKEKDEVKKLVKEKKAVSSQLVSDFADFCIPATGLGYLSLDEGLVGIAGMVSSIIGLKAAWAKTA